MRKPTGRDGAISLSGTGASFLPTSFPETKEEIELFVARKFATFKSSRRLFAFDIVGEPTQNPTDDFDFNLATSVGPKYLELMEAHFSGIGTYLPSGQYMYEPHRIADALFTNIKRKSDRYRGATTRGIVLLVYSTHCEFALSNVAVWLVAHKIHTTQPVFESVYHITLSDPGADVKLLFPTNVDFTAFDPEKYRENRDILLDPAKFQVDVRPAAG